jgi:hypothetical protein
MRRKASSINQEVALGITSQEVIPGEISGEVMRQKTSPEVRLLRRRPSQVNRLTKGRM